MNAITKFEKVIIALEANEEIRDWYATEHGLTADMLTEQNVKVYGRGGFGDLADMILQEQAIELRMQQEDADAGGWMAGSAGS